VFHKKGEFFCPGEQTSAFHSGLRIKALPLATLLHEGVIHNPKMYDTNMSAYVNMHGTATCKVCIHWHNYHPRPFSISNFHFTAQRMVNVIISRLWTKSRHATLKRLQEGRQGLNRHLSSKLNLWTLFIVLVYLRKSITTLYGEQLKRHVSDLPLTLINVIQLHFYSRNWISIGQNCTNA
jgi:hypothetical protein